MKGDDLTGRTFDRWTVLNLESTSPRKWRCRCVCGVEKLVYSGSLLSQRSKSCGCIQKEFASVYGKANLDAYREKGSPYKIDLTGLRFDRLVVIGYAGKNNAKVNLWHCECECGGTYIARGTQLQNKGVRSCGCLRGPEVLPDSLAAKRMAYRRIVASAKARKIVFDLSFEYVCDMIIEDCHYCGVAPILKDMTNHSIAINGIDRIDSRLGYTIDNVLPCCTICNYAKRTTPYDEFIAWIDRLVAYRQEGHLDTE